MRLTDPADDLLAPFEAARPALFGLSYRLLGSAADAEDVLQDVFVKWATVERAAIRNPQAWLVTACTRRALDLLRSHARSRTAYVGPWLPEPLAATRIDEPQDMSESLETAFLAVLHQLGPSERAAFLLHDVFGTGHATVAGILQISETASRKLASRARARVRDGGRTSRLPPAREAELLARFEEAILTDDASSLAVVLEADVRLKVDSGGKVQSITEPVIGRAEVLAFLTRARAWWRGYDWTPTALATGTGIVLRSGAHTAATIWFESQGGRDISAIDIMRNPDKLP